jgi:hypothetical protein
LPRQKARHDKARIGGAALNYRLYDSPLYRFVWDVQEKGPAAVNELDRLRREHPGLVERDRIGFVASSFMDAGMLPQALALLESDLPDHPRSGKAAVAVAEAGVKTGPVAWTGGELTFSFTIPLEGGMEIRTRLTAQGATLKGRCRLPTSPRPPAPWPSAPRTSSGGGERVEAPASRGFTARQRKSSNSIRSEPLASCCVNRKVRPSVESAKPRWPLRGDLASWATRVVLRLAKS